MATKSGSQLLEKKARRFWGAHHLRDEFRPLPKSLRYSVESLEPRYLLSVAPISLANPTNDGSAAADNAYKTAVSKAVQTVVVGQTASQSVIGGLSYLGQQVDKTSITNPTSSNKIPLLNQSPNDLMNLATTTTGGTQAGNITFGDLLLNETDSNGNNLFSQALTSIMSSTNKPSTD